MAIYINDEVVNKSKLFELLSINKNSIPSPREKRFQFPTRTDKDGNKRHLHRLMCNAFSVYIPTLNREVQVRIATTQKKDKDQNFEYFPTDNAMECGEGGAVLINDEMAFLFWYINPMNRQSPFRKPSSPVFYEFLDNDHLAKVDNDIDETRIIAMSIVLGNNAWSISRLRTLAKGMGIAGVTDMTDEVVKNTLKARAYQKPSEFINMAESREVAFSGKIQEAIDAHILDLRTLNGMQRWYLGGKEVIPVQYGIDARKVLEEHISEKWYMYSDELNNLLEGITVSTNLSKPENDLSFEETGAVETLAEVDNELWKAYVELKKDYGKFEKIKKWAEQDENDPKTHVLTKKAMENNAEEIALYRKVLAAEKEGLSIA